MAIFKAGVIKFSKKTMIWGIYPAVSFRDLFSTCGSHPWIRLACVPALVAGRTLASTSGRSGTGGTGWYQDGGHPVVDGSFIDGVS